jgi:2-polyprenyl-6-methoxyphenol hydroxylase-like FAD-dependent oxidoreductase
MWNVGLRARVGLDDLSPEALQQHDLQRIRGWHPDVRLLVGAGDPAAAFLAPGLTAGRPASWSPSRVTTMGDAAHAMPPDRGSGANLALADAARLVAALARVDDDDRAGLLRAVGHSERVMVEQAFAVSDAGPATDRR